MSGIHQKLVNDYHVDMERSMPHHSHNMHLFHRNWHRMNPDPNRETFPSRPDPYWGTNLIFGYNFLEMHHEMVKALDSEPRDHMHHSSIASWYKSKNYDFPKMWDPPHPIPADLSYEPDIEVFPDEIKRALIQAAKEQGVDPERLLMRQTNNPSFKLPAYFTRKGVTPDERGEPITGALKLSDFKNVNQLGCCIVIPHNSWHSRIGGAMSSTWTAIADPIFYWGVHWHIDRVYDEFKLIQAEKKAFKFDMETLSEKSLVENDEPIPEEFSQSDKLFIKEAIATSNKLSQLPKIV